MQDKSKPQDPATEEAVLGALLIEASSLDRVSDMLDSQVFYSKQRSLIYQAISQLAAQSKPVDLVTVKNQLISEGCLEEAGGAAYLVELTNKVGSTANIEYHSQLLQEYSIKRRLITTGYSLIKQGYEETQDVFSILTEAERTIFELSNPVTGRPAQAIEQAIPEVIKSLEQAQDNELVGVPSYCQSFDKITQGYRAGDLNILAARPGQGKTAKALQEAYQQAAAGYSVAFFSLEMKRELLLKRLFANLGQINTMKVNSGNLQADDWRAINKASQELEGLKLFIDDEPGLNFLSLKSKLRKIKQSSGLDIVYVDYLQLMDPLKGHGNREGEISEISRGLKAAATELDIPVVALSQLNRKVDEREPPVPKLTDLRESGSLEQDASLVSFIYWPKSYGKEDEEDERLSHLLISKNRHGMIADAPVLFLEEYGIFRDFEQEGPEGSSGSVPF